MTRHAVGPSFPARPEPGEGEAAQAAARGPGGLAAAGPSPAGRTPRAASRLRGPRAAGSASLSPAGFGSSRPPGPRAADVLRCAAAGLSEAGIDTARLDAEVLLMEALGWSREDLYRNPEAELQEFQAARFRGLAARRRRGEPAAYITGSREFWSLDFQVTPDVLIPRPETEHLVQTVLDLLAEGPGPRRVLDLGTGSGAVAVALAAERADLEVWATDVSAAALRVARANAQRHGVAGRVHLGEGDLFAPVRGREGFFDVLASNPPYVPRGRMPRLQREVRDWEPAAALDGGADGMDCYRRIAREGARYLRPGGWAAVEVGSELASGVRGLFRDSAGFGELRTVRDYAGRERVVAAERA